MITAQLRKTMLQLTCPDCGARPGRACEFMLEVSTRGDASTVIVGARTRRHFHSARYVAARLYIANGSQEVQS